MGAGLRPQAERPELLRPRAVERGAAPAREAAAVDVRAPEPHGVATLPDDRERARRRPRLGPGEPAVRHEHARDDDVAVAREEEPAEELRVLREPLRVEAE